MRLSALVLMFFLASAVSACAAVQVRVLDIDAINQAMDDAAASGAQWPGKPMQALHELFGGNQRNYAGNASDPVLCGSSDSSVAVLIMRGSFSRDWGWGDWCEVHFRKIEDGTWRLCYVLPMDKRGANIRRPSVPLKAKAAEPQTR